MIKRIWFFIRLVSIAITPPMFDFQRLERYAKKAINNNRDEVLFKEYLGELYFGFGKLRESRDVWEEVLLVKPVPKNIFEYCKVLYSLKEFEMARIEFKKIPDIYFGTYEIGKYWGLNNMQTGDFQEALTILKKIVERARAKRDGTVFRGLGYCSFKLDDLARSIEYLNEAKKYSPDDKEISRSLEIAQSELERKMNLDGVVN
jgi:tetratricopeptide (TPR) repeat protein